MSHEEYTAVSDQIDDALSGSTHFIHWLNKYISSSLPSFPSSPASSPASSNNDNSNMNSNIFSKFFSRSTIATGKDVAGSYAFLVGQTQFALLQHLENEQNFFLKLKTNVYEPLFTHVTQIKQAKDNIDKQMRALMIKIMNGKRRLVSEKKTFLQVLDEYKICLYEADNNVAQQKKLPNVRKKLFDLATKYERTVKELQTTEEEYKQEIPSHLSTLHSLELSRLTDIQTRVKSLSLLLLERVQSMLVCRNRLESFVSQLAPAKTQHDSLLLKWHETFMSLSEVPLVFFDLPLSSHEIETFSDLASITNAEEKYELFEQQTLTQNEQLKQTLLQRQKKWEEVEKAEFVNFTQKSQQHLRELYDVPVYARRPPSSPPPPPASPSATTISLPPIPSSSSSTPATVKLLRARVINKEENTEGKQEEQVGDDIEPRKEEEGEGEGKEEEKELGEETGPIEKTSPTSAWVKLFDNNTINQHGYYYENTLTGETSFEPPDDYVEEEDKRPASNSLVAEGKKSPPPPDIKNQEEKVLDTPPPLFKSESLLLLPVSDYAHIPVSTEGLPSEEKMRLVGEVQKLFSNTSFAVEGRFFVRHGVLVKKSRRKSQAYEFFLFNDLLVWGKRLLKGQKLRMHKCLMLDSSFAVQDLPPKPTVAQEFAIHGVLKSFVVSCATSREKQVWLTAITECWEARKGQNNEQDLQHAPIWTQNVEKDHCPVCKRNFNPFRRKHHCRLCGELRCADCCATKMSVRGTASQRVCLKCNNKPDINRHAPKVVRSASMSIPATSLSRSAAPSKPTPLLMNPVVLASPKPSKPAPPPLFDKSDSRLWLQADVWTVGTDEASGRAYYYNTTTGESTWTKPPELERLTVS